MINHGGQNPLEAVRFGCNIFHGPNVTNFKEIYWFLKNKNLSQRVTNYKNLANLLSITLKNKSQPKKIKKSLYLIGKNILNKTYKEIC